MMVELVSAFDSKCVGGWAINYLVCAIVTFAFLSQIAKINPDSAHDLDQGQPANEFI